MTDELLKYKDIDVVLIYPKTGQDLGVSIASPHSLLAIAAPLHDKKYKVRIIDMRTDRQWRKSLIEALKAMPICVGISAMVGTQIYFAIEAAKVVREHTDGKIPIVWGGPHPSVLPEQTLESEYVDIVCIGEGDITFLELVSALKSRTPISHIQGIAYKNGGRVIITPPRPLLDVETLLPAPWELVNVEDYIHLDFYLKNSRRVLDIGQTSRGCPFLCGFCSSASIRQRKWRPMSVERSLQVIIEPVKRFNLDGIWIRDDEFYIDRNRAQAICEGMIKAGLKIGWYTSGTRVDIFNGSSDEQIALLKKSGAHTLKFGAESGSNRMLKLMNKGIRAEDTLKANLRARKHGIIPAYAFMVGFPTETFQDINETVDLIKRLKKDNPAAQLETIAIFTALPGTPLFDLAIKIRLKPPRALSEWANWLFDEYDLKGRQIPWFSYEDRIKIGNLTYISMLSNAISNATDGIGNSFFRRILKFFLKPIVYFYNIRLNKKWYGFAPELKIVRYLRKRLFYRTYFVIK